MTHPRGENEARAHQVWVAMGSNRDPRRELPAALEKLCEHFGSVRLSTVYRNPPDGIVGPDFFNAVATFQTQSSPREVVRHLKFIEDDCGRQRGASVSGPKGLDLDLLLFDALICDEPDLVLPHPDVLLKPYVLAPLAELAPDMHHPIDGRTWGELWSLRVAGYAPLTPVELSLPAILTSQRCDHHRPA